MYNLLILKRIAGNGPLVAIGVLLFLIIMARPVLAQEGRVIATSGLNGEELVCLAVHPKDGNVVFLGTKRGLYRKDISKQNDVWKLVPGFPSEGCRVNQIFFGEVYAESFVATDRGLFVFKDDGQRVENIFTRSENNERDCLSTAVLGNGTIFAGTQAGLFYKNKNENNWLKAASLFNQNPILYLFGNKESIYVAIPDGIYKSLDSGRRWEKIFNVQDYKENGENDDTESQEETTALSVRHMAGIKSSPDVLYCATSHGIFVTEDAGKKWKALQISGLDSAQLRFISMDKAARRLLAVLKTGIYEYQDSGWKLLVIAYDPQQAILRSDDIIFITQQNIFQYQLDGKKTFFSRFEQKENDLLSFGQEPTVQEVQKMAISYAEVSDKKITDWRRRARLKAFMPEVSFDYDKTVTTALGASYDKVQVGPMDWGINLKWDMGDLIYNSDETSIDSRSKLMVELRNDILAEVTRLYFERRKLQVELVKNNQGEKENIDKKLRLMELTAMLDRLTGCNFTRVLKSAD